MQIIIIHVCFFTQSHEEFKEMYLKQQFEYQTEDRSTNLHNVRINVTYPTSLDWRTKGFVSSVRIILLHLHRFGNMF